MIAEHANQRPFAEFGALDEATTSRIADTAVPLMGTPAAAVTVVAVAGAFAAGYAAGQAGGSDHPIVNA